MDSNKCIIIFEDGLTGKVLQTIDTDYIQDIDVIEGILNEIFYLHYFGNKHNLIIKFGYKPM
jgi:hypothetical protein